MGEQLGSVVCLGYSSSSFHFRRPVVCLPRRAVHVVPKNSDPNYLPPKDDAQTCLPMFAASKRTLELPPLLCATNNLIRFADDFCSSEGSSPSGSSSSLLKSIRALPVDACTYVVWASGWHCARVVLCRVAYAHCNIFFFFVKASFIGKANLRLRLRRQTRFS